MQPLLVRLGLNAKDFNAGFLEARKNLEGIKKNTDELSKSMQSMNKVAKLAFSAWGIYNVREGLQSIIRYVGEVSIELDRMKRSMNAATGSISLGAYSIKFLQQESQRLGLQFRDQIKGFQQLAAAAKGTSLTYKDVREVWLGISEASTVMQLSSEQNKYALYALQQMISKGVVTMEELRRQLGDQIPGAFQIAARAMGVTTQELIKMVSTGNLISEEFVPKFARQLRKEMAGSVEDASQSIYANINRLKNEFYSLGNDIATSSGGIETFNDALKEFIEYLKDPDTKKTIENASKLFVDLAKAIAFVGKVSTKIIEVSGIGDIVDSMVNLEDKIKQGTIIHLTEDIEKYTTKLQKTEDRIKQIRKDMDGWRGSLMGKDPFLEMIDKENSKLLELAKTIDELKNKRNELIGQSEKILTGKQVPDDIYGDTTEWELNKARRQEIIKNFEESILSSESKAILKLNKDFEVINKQLENLHVTTEELVRLQNAYAKALDQFAQKRKSILDKWDALASGNKENKALIQLKRDYDRDKQKLIDLKASAEELAKLESDYRKKINDIVENNKKKRESLINKWEAKGTALKQDSEIAKLKNQYEDTKRQLENLNATAEEIAKLENAYNRKITDVLNDNSRSRKDIIDKWKELSGNLTDEEQRLLDLEIKYREARAKLIDIGASASELAELKQAFEVARVKATDFYKTFMSFVDDIRDTAKNVFRDIFDNNADMWQNMLDRMKDAYLNMISELLSNAIMKKFEKFLEGKITGANMSGSVDNNALPGQLTNIFGKPSYNYAAAGLLGAYGATQPNQTYFGAAASGALAGYSIGGPYGALAGAAGGVIGKWLFGKDEKPQNIEQPEPKITIGTGRNIGFAGYRLTGGYGSYFKPYDELYTGQINAFDQYDKKYNLKAQKEFRQFYNELNKIKNNIADTVQEVLLKIPSELSSRLESRLNDLYVYGFTGDYEYDWSALTEKMAKGINDQITRSIANDMQRYIQSSDAYKLLSGITQEELIDPYLTYANGTATAMPFQDIEGILEAIDYLNQVEKVWNDITLTTKEFIGESTVYERGIFDINNAFDQMRDTLIDLGVSIENINEVESQRQEALNYYAIQMSDQRADILEQWLIMSGDLSSFEIQRLQLLNQYNESIAQLRELNAPREDISQLTHYYNLALSNLAQEQLNQQSVNTIEDFTDKIKDLLDQWRISSGVLTDYEASLLDLENSFISARESLTEYGASLDEMNELQNLYDMSVANTIESFNNEISSIIEQWKISSGVFNEYESALLDLQNQYDSARESLISFGASTEQLNQLEGLYETSIGNLIDSFTNNVTDSFKNIQNSWSAFFDNIMNDLSPVQSSAYLGQRLSSLYGAANTEEGINNLLEFVQSEYLPFMKAYGESDYNTIWENIRDLTGNITYNGQNIGGIDYDLMGSTIGEYVSTAMSNDNSRIIIQIGDRVLSEIMLSELKNNNPEFVSEIRRVING